MTTPAAKNLPSVIEALASVMGEVQSVGKDERNTQQNFRYRGIDAVVNAVGPAFRTFGVLCIPTEIVALDSEHYVTKNGANMRGVTMRVRFRFYGPAGDYIEAEASGEAADAGDKAVSKAHSVAYRTVLLQALCIPTGDPDPDSQTHERAERRVEGPPPVPVPKGWAELERLVRSADNSEEAWLLFSAFVRAASYHLFGKTDSAELEQAEKDVLWQKSAGAVVWLAENAKNEGPFTFYDETQQRQAWASVLDGTALAIPDYVPPEPPLDEVAQAEVDRIAEALAWARDAAAATTEELAAEDTAPKVPQD